MAALLVLAVAAAVQAAVFLLSGSVALLGDLIHNAADALTAVPLGAAFLLRSRSAERLAGFAVVAFIFASACVAGYEAVVRLVDPRPLDHLSSVALAGALGVFGNLWAARIRERAGRKVGSAALLADAAHARADAWVSLAVVLDAGAVAVGASVADPLIGLGISAVILWITWSSWRTIRDDDGPSIAHQNASGLPSRGVD